MFKLQGEGVHKVAKVVANSRRMGDLVIIQKGWGRSGNSGYGDGGGQVLG